MTQKAPFNFIKKLIPTSFLLFAGLFSNAQVWNIGTEYFIQGSAVEIGIGGAGGFEGADCVSSVAPVQPAGMHFRSNTQYFGFIANPALDGWVVYDGDFFTPGAPENGWGVEIGGTSGTKLSNNCLGDLDIPGSVTHTENINGCLSVTWEGNSTAGGNIHYIIEYQMNENDLFYTTKVKMINTGATTLNDIYYYRNVDPDNNVVIGTTYVTTNKIEAQPTAGGCSKAHVSAKQASPHSSYLGFAGVDPNFKVGHGGFSNRDASDMHLGVGFTSAVGAATTSDIAMFITYLTPTILPGDSSVFKFVVILSSSSAETAINSLFYFNYTGGLGLAPAICSYEIDTVPSCPGKTVNIELLGSNLDDFNWVWTPSLTLDTDTGLIVNASPTSTTLYTVTGTPDSGSCFTIPVIQEIVVSMEQSSTINFDVVTSNPICLAIGSAEVVNITGGIGPVTIQWTGGPTTSLYDSIFAGIYEVTLTDSFGCFADTLVYLSNISTLTSSTVIDSMALCGYPSGMFTITASAGMTPYTYDIGLGSNTTGVFSGLTDSTYVVGIGDGNGCLIFVPVIIADTSLINISVSTVDEICDGVNGTALVGGSFIGLPATYTLGATTQGTPNFTGLASGVYSVIVNDHYGCADTASFTIGDSSNFDAHFVSRINDECNANIGQIVVAGTNGVTPYTYAILPASSTSTTGTFNGLPDGSYVVTVSTPGGACTDTIHVTILELPSTLAGTVGNVTDENCGIYNGIYDIDVTGGHSPYVYSNGGPSQISNTFTGLNDGNYTATITDSLGCTTTVPVTVGEIPLDINLGPDILYCNQFNILGNGVGTYLWSTGETTHSIIVTASGDYWLNVSTPDCFDIDTIHIELVDEPKIVVPNVFTPNGDGYNDKFEILGQFINSYKLNIYNRWGQLMFTTNDINSMWDGKQDGQEVSPGVYMYIIEYVNPCETPSEQTRNGAVQLFR